MCVLLALAWQRQGWRSCFIGGEAKRRASQVSWHTASAWADNDIRGHVGATIERGTRRGWVWLGWGVGVAGAQRAGSAGDSAGPGAGGAGGARPSGIPRSTGYTARQAMCRCASPPAVPIDLAVTIVHTSLMLMEYCISQLFSYIPKLNNRELD